MVYGYWLLVYFLSRLCGGELYKEAAKLKGLFLSRLCGGEH